MDADVRPGADGRHRLRLREDLGVRPDTDLEVLRPRALGDQRLLETGRFRGARPHRSEVVADDRDDRAADALRFRWISARLLLDDALEHARHERHAGRLQRLQVARRQQPRLRGVARVVRRVRKQVGKRADARKAGGGADGARRMLELEQRAARRGHVRQIEDLRAANGDQRGPLDRRKVGASDEDRFRGIRR